MFNISFNFLRSPESIEFNTLRSNLIEMKAALRNQQKVQNEQDGAVNQTTIPLVMFSDPQRFYYNKPLLVRIWIWIRSWFYTENPEEAQHKLSQALLVTVHSLFDRCVIHAYSQYQNTLKHYIHQAGKVYSDESDTVQSLRQERFKVYTGTILNANQNDQGSVTLSIEEEKNHPVLSKYQLGKIRARMATLYKVIFEVWTAFLKKYSASLPGALNTELLKPYLKAEKADGHFIHNKEAYRLFKRAIALINLESIFRKPIPIQIFSKLSNLDSRLSVSEERELKRLIELLNQNIERKSTRRDKNPFKMEPRQFRQALQEIAFILHMEGHKSMQVSEIVANLAYQMDVRGCKLVTLEDSKHLNWRCKLKPGDKVTCQGEESITYILGNPINEERVDDHYIVFNLEGYDDRVLRIGQNRLEPYVETSKFKQPTLHWGVKPVKILDVDMAGKCMILEKLYPLAPWTSQSDQLNAKDKELALVLANHLYWMWGWRNTPRDLDGRFIGRNEVGELKSTHLLPKASINYDELEKWCLNLGQFTREASNQRNHEENHQNKNWAVIKFIMHVSTLFHHPVAEFYRGAVFHAIQSGETDLIKRVLPEGYTDAHYQDRVGKLCQEALDLATQCYKKVKLERGKLEIHDHRQDKQLETSVREVLAHLYANSPSPGTLFPDLLESQVVDILVNKFPKLLDTQSNKVIDVLVKEKKVDALYLSEDLKSYYKKCCEDLERLNKKAQEQQQVASLNLSNQDA